MVLNCLQQKLASPFITQSRRRSPATQSTMSCRENSRLPLRGCKSPPDQSPVATRKAKTSTTFIMMRWTCLPDGNTRPYGFPEHFLPPTDAATLIITLRGTISILTLADLEFRPRIDLSKPENCPTCRNWRVCLIGGDTEASDWDLILVRVYFGILLPLDLWLCLCESSHRSVFLTAWHANPR